MEAHERNPTILAFYRRTFLFIHYFKWFHISSRQFYIVLWYVLLMTFPIEQRNHFIVLEIIIFFYYYYYYRFSLSTKVIQLQLMMLFFSGKYSIGIALVLGVNGFPQGSTPRKYTRIWTHASATCSKPNPQFTSAHRFIRFHRNGCI